MSAEDEGVTLAEVNRNVTRLFDRVDSFATNYLTLKQYEENRTETGRRIGSIENELAERRRSFTNTFMYPLVIAIIAAGLAALIAVTLGG